MSDSGPPTGEIPVVIPADGPAAEPRPAPGGRPVPPPPRHGPRGWSVRRVATAVVAGAVVVVVGLVVYGVVWYEGQIHGGPEGAQTVVQVEPGSTMRQVETSLVAHQVASSALALRIYFFLHGSPTVLSGGYSFRRNEPFASLRARLAAGPNVLVVPAGFTVAETAARVGEFPGHDASAFEALVQNRAVISRYEQPGTPSLDGLLAPGQYILTPGESDAAVLAEMVTRFDDEAAAAGLDQGAAALGITPYQAITVASIVEKEGVYPQNLAKVARVVYNRLTANMPLQMDSTVLFSEGRDGGKVTAADLARNTPYNTYLHKGLTPTPICFPSTASLQAALHPAAGNWLYFVLVSRDGTEAFSDTLAGQLANEQLAKSRGLG